jgi:hypothetical protein
VWVLKCGLVAFQRPTEMDFAQTKKNEWDDEIELLERGVENLRCFIKMKNDSVKAYEAKLNAFRKDEAFNDAVQRVKRIHVALLQREIKTAGAKLERMKNRLTVAKRELSIHVLTNNGLQSPDVWLDTC